MSGMYWMILALTTVGAAAVMFGMIAGALVLANRLERWWGS